MLKNSLLAIHTLFSSKRYLLSSRAWVVFRRKVQVFVNFSVQFKTWTFRCVSWTYVPMQGFLLNEKDFQYFRSHWFGHRFIGTNKIIFWGWVYSNRHRVCARFVVGHNSCQFVPFLLTTNSVCKQGFCHHLAIQNCFSLIILGFPAIYIAFSEEVKIFKLA